MSKLLLLGEVKQCLLTLQSDLNKALDEPLSLQEILDLVSVDEVSGLLYGWLASKGLWKNELDTKELFDLAVSELKQ
jgi:hypothetical protein